MSPAPSDASPPDREDALDRAATGRLDVVVVGGGITGAGIALDAATRGYRVALVERDDLASGTSSRSSKMVHGGIRYLAQHDLGLVFEAARERDRLRQLAPHLVRPLGFVVPVDDRSSRAPLKAGLAVYDGLAAFRNLRRHRRLEVGEVLEAAPGLARGFGNGGYRYHDCQTDDARLTLQVAQTARGFGALVVNHAEVVGLLRFGGRVVGVAVRDRLSGRMVELIARWTVSATGVWADTVRGLAPEHRPDLLTPSKGVHLAFRRQDLDVRRALVIPSGEYDGRQVFLVPWGEQVYAGTTDEHYTGPLDAAFLAPPEAGYLLHAVNTAFDRHLTLADAVGGWAGLRPLLRGATPDIPSKDLSRRHALFEDPPGLLTITGGKLTTYRQMAEDAVDRLAAADGNRRRCLTARVALGARGTAEHGLARTVEVCHALGTDPSLAGSLYHRHGDRAAEVLTSCLEHGEADRLVGDLPYLAGEVRWAVREELARTLDDALQRRLRVSLRDRQAGGRAVGRAAAIMAGELGWDPAERERQISDYLDRVARERGVLPLDRSWQAAAQAPRTA